MASLARIATDLGTDEQRLRAVLKSSERQVKKYDLKKKAGGKRRIVVPPRPSKAIQYWLITKILRNIPINPSATAYHPGASTRTNASRHANGKYFVQADIKDFFPSISIDSFFDSLVSESDDLVSELVASKDDNALSMCLGYKRTCAIGYPISPYISNIVMRDVDCAINAKLSERQDEFGTSAYTRYADDMVISIAEKGFKHQILDIIRESLSEGPVPGLELNESKIHFTSRNAGTPLITGLRVCRDGHLTLHKSYKDRVRLLFNLAAKGKLDSSERGQLLGHLYYCRAADPPFYSKLASKHVALIARLKSDL